MVTDNDDEQASFRYRVVSDRETIEAIGRLAHGDPALSLGNLQEERDVTKLGLDLGDLAAVVAVVKGLAGLATLVSHVYSALGKRRTVIEVQGPTRVVRITTDAELTEEGLVAIFKEAAKL